MEEVTVWVETFFTTPAEKEKYFKRKILMMKREETRRHAGILRSAVTRKMMWESR
jgi:hypothetical protein